jgi:purine nucleosidase/pyrimidine-specific ribonucleoside hydrolase
VAVPCILDCDPGHDDAIAILLAAAHPALELRAITTVAGNAPLDKVTLNARRICTLAGIRGVPIAAGAEGPADGVLEPAADVHGKSGLDGPELPAPDVELDPRPAVDLIADELAAAGEPITLFATGPLTNVAAALARVDRERIREIVWMGGSTERGNRTPYAEFNAWVDPRAAAAVVASGVPFTMVGLNLTHQALATADVIARMRALGTRLGDTVAGWFELFGANYRSLFGAEAPPVHDPCAIALVAEPGVVRCVDAFLAIETDGRWTRGATVVDLRGRLGRESNARIAIELDAVRLWDTVVAAVDRLGSTPADPPARGR